MLNSLELGLLVGGSGDGGDGGDGSDGDGGGGGGETKKKQIPLFNRSTNNTLSQ